MLYGIEYFPSCVAAASHKAGVVSASVWVVITRAKRTVAGAMREVATVKALKELGWTPQFVLLAHERAKVSFFTKLSNRHRERAAKTAGKDHFPIFEHWRVDLDAALCPAARDRLSQKRLLSGKMTTRASSSARLRARARALIHGRGRTLSDRLARRASCRLLLATPPDFMPPSAVALARLCHLPHRA